MIRKLEAFTGYWFGVTELYPSPAFPTGAMLDTSCKSELDLAGRVVVGRENRRTGGQVIYQALSLFGWDADREQYTLQRFDTSERPFAEPAFGDWCGNVLTLEWTATQGRVRAEYAVTDEMYYVLRIAARGQGRGWRPVLESRLERLGQ